MLEGWVSLALHPIYVAILSTRNTRLDKQSRFIGWFCPYSSLVQWQKPIGVICTPGVHRQLKVRLRCHRRYVPADSGFRAGRTLLPCSNSWLTCSPNGTGNCGRYIVTTAGAKILMTIAQFRPATLCGMEHSPCQVVTAKDPPGTEAEARHWRYRVFEQLAVEQECLRIATGHTATDPGRNPALQSHARQWGRMVCRPWVGNDRLAILPLGFRWCAPC